jgi:hypothetical protein
VIAIYDDGGKTISRYEVVFSPASSDGVQFFPILYMSSDPFHPQGFGQHGECLSRPTRMAGQRVIDWADLPERCKQCVLQDLEVNA